MKESRLYLNFFKRNLFSLLIPSVVFSVFGFYYQHNYPPIYNKTRLVEFVYSEDKIDSVSLQSDNAVTALRSENLQISLGVDREIKVVVYKNGPTMVNLVVFSAKKDDLGKELDKLYSYLYLKYQVNTVGNDLDGVEKVSALLTAFTGFSLGFFVGLVVSLVKEYFRNF